VRLLLDTQIVQWLAIRPDLLRIEERRLIENPSNELAVSAVSLWEMRIKWQTSYRSGQRKGEADPEKIVGTLDESGLEYTRLWLSFAHCTATLREPFDHNDPFDRFLLAQAQVEGLRLLTRDDKFAGHPSALIA
jgi:PIN domain nuclease of toxin-antitoxin system